MGRMVLLMLGVTGADASSRCMEGQLRVLNGIGGLCGLSSVTTNTAISDASTPGMRIAGWWP